MITALNNNRMKRVVQLNQKAKIRKEENVFVVEGLKMFLEAPIERIREVYVSESFYHKTQHKEKIQQCSYEIVSDLVFEKIADTKTPQGILCIIDQFSYTLASMLNEKNPLFLILEDIQDPGNLGTMIRTGEGAGVTGIIMSKDTVDVYNPKTIRSTMGSIYRVPFLYEESLPQVLELLHQKQVKTYAAHLKNSQFYDEFSYIGGTAFLIGNEGNGLKEETANLSEKYLKIPMEGQVESLNAAIAASILMYEASRQRRV